MLFHLIAGAAAAIALIWLYQKYGKNMSIWGTVLTVLAVLYSVFVLEVIYGFIIEHAVRAGMVMGLVTGIVAVIWWVLLSRFVFAKKAS